MLYTSYMKEVEIYTDGACSGNPGIGGYAVILTYNKIEKILRGGEKKTTNNRMELTAVIKGLLSLKERCIVHVYSDSSYVCNAVNNNWLTKWQLNGWKNSSKKEVLNRDLWEKLLRLISYHKVTFHKVKGHSKDKKNNRCDKIAKEQIKKLSSN